MTSWNIINDEIGNALSNIQLMQLELEIYIEKEKVNLPKKELDILYKRLDSIKEAENYFHNLDPSFQR